MSTLIIILETVKTLSSNMRTLTSHYSHLGNYMIQLEGDLRFMEIPSEKGYKNLEVIEKRMRKNDFDMEDLENQEGWKNTGEIEIKDLKLRYRAALENVLRGVNLKIKSGDKVGIVGRTGAGKSTLIKSFYGRFSDFEGELKIGGQDIRKIDLKVLRKSMSVIP